MDEMILILDFGGAYALPAAYKLRGSSVYCEILPHNTPIEEIRGKNPKGILLIGGSEDAFAENAPRIKAGLFTLNVPILGIGYGARALARYIGARLVDSLLDKHTQQVSLMENPLFDGMTRLERYFERVDQIEFAQDVEVIARSQDGAPVAFAWESRNIYGMQFYPERNDPDGLQILTNFARKICGCEKRWEILSFIDGQVEHIRHVVGDGEALLAVSGGIDSAVAAVIMHRAIGRRMHCIHIDTGLMRTGETTLIQEVFANQLGMDLIRIDASDRFLRRLRGVTKPEQKHKIISEELTNVFVDAAMELNGVDCLVQGTIYSDVLAAEHDESVSIARRTGDRLVDKTHIKKMIEPVRMLFKDEVRQAGEALGLPAKLVHRQQFPVTGLALRCLGEVTAHKLRLLRAADAIFEEEIVGAGIEKRIWQSFVVLTDIRSPSVREALDEYEYTVALRAVSHHNSDMVMAYRLPYDLLERVVQRVASEVPGINRVVYDLTGKPPATIEWE